MSDRLSLAALCLIASCLLWCSGCGDKSDGAAQKKATAQDKSSGKQKQNSSGKQKQDPAPAKQGEKKQFTNRLAKETSPYLLLHAHNPVDWYPWGEEAFAKAKKENKPIFLSVGYSSCHWCHVMERESFMDEEIAAFLNKHFVCIKVDREERPDVDNIYMTAVQLVNRSGGWPMSVFMLPDGRPFFGGTYFPARDGDRGSRVGFLTLVKRVQEVWTTDQPELVKNAEEITRLVKAELDGRIPLDIKTLGRDDLDAVQQSLTEQFDEQYGGFSMPPFPAERPKFPEPSNLFFLLHRIDDAQLSDEDRAQAQKMLVSSLDGMGIGGIRDHVGGGFHRYSVDRFWKIPHFEKMLYDNGQLASVYAEAYRITKDEEYRRITEELIHYVMDEMRDEGGAFYSALDAESEGEEGKFYRWSAKELKQLLTERQRELMGITYGTAGEPNFEEKYFVPERRISWAEAAEKAKLSEEELRTQLTEARKVLFEHRAKRDRPLTDTKILTSWNGLMIRGLADAGRIFERPEYIEAATQAANFVLDKLMTPEGRLLRTYGQGEAKLDAYLNDYAFLVDGLIALYRATDERAWLDKAAAITDKQIELFWDERDGGFFFTAQDQESLLARARKPYDGAQPAGNSVAAQNLLALATELKREDYSQRAAKTISSVGGLIRRAPAAAPRMALALAAWLETQPIPEPEEELEAEADKD